MLLPVYIQKIGINFSVLIFIQKYQVGLSMFFSFNLVSIVEKMMQFCHFLLNFLNQINVFS